MLLLQPRGHSHAAPQLPLGLQTWLRAQANQAGHSTESGPGGEGRAPLSVGRTGRTSCHSAITFRHRPTLGAGGGWDPVGAPGALRPPSWLLAQSWARLALSSGAPQPVHVSTPRARCCQARGNLFSLRTAAWSSFWPRGTKSSQRKNRASSGPPGSQEPGQHPGSHSEWSRWCQQHLAGPAWPQVGSQGCTAWTCLLGQRCPRPPERAPRQLGPGRAWIQTRGRRLAAPPPSVWPGAPPGSNAHPPCSEFRGCLSPLGGCFPGL